MYIDKYVYNYICMSRYQTIHIIYILYIYICKIIYTHPVMCEWELGYSITHVPMYIAFIFPLPKGHNCRPFGSSTTAGPPRKQPSCRSCESPVIVSESKSPQYQQGTYISERISDSQVISRTSPTEPTSG